MGRTSAQGCSVLPAAAWGLGGPQTLPPPRPSSSSPRSSARQDSPLVIPHWSPPTIPSCASGLATLTSCLPAPFLCHTSCGPRRICPAVPSHSPGGQDRVAPMSAPEQPRWVPWAVPHGPVSAPCQPRWAPWAGLRGPMSALEQPRWALWAGLCGPMSASEKPRWAPWAVPCGPVSAPDQTCWVPWAGPCGPRVSPGEGQLRAAVGSALSGDMAGLSLGTLDCGPSNVVFSKPS